MSLAHGGSKLCSSSQPWTESHSSTTVAVTDLPFPARITTRFRHRLPPSNHPVESATTFSPSSKNVPVQLDAPPPSPLSAKLLSVSVARVPRLVTAGEHAKVAYLLPSSQHTESFSGLQLPDLPRMEPLGRQVWRSARWGKVARARGRMVASAKSA
ncbi:hypothetical protein HU200_049590 [Digitaria exilis]|uniref:Uncharacterized protein n=1 Tax=Digitaria exilis TaxID=1010633 RepID=A0A835AUR7_9POAL|nr:hypothetical protein HU200_049590 [Digitaria exilis]